jgi:protein-tyrosine phosphatase
MIKVLFFCTANVCRSPVAAGVCEAVLAAGGLGERFWIDSAGTHAAAGRPAHAESRRVAASHGIDISQHRSRPLEPADFREFDYLIGMDQANIAAAKGIGSAEFHPKLRLLQTDAAKLIEIPDPFTSPPAGSGNSDGFEHVHGLITAGVNALIVELRLSVEARRSHGES